MQRDVMQLHRIRLQHGPHRIPQFPLRYRPGPRRRIIWQLMNRHQRRLLVLFFIHVLFPPRPAPRSFPVGKRLHHIIQFPSHLFQFFCRIHLRNVQIALLLEKLNLLLRQRFHQCSSQLDGFHSSQIQRIPPGTDLSNFGKKTSALHNLHRPLLPERLPKYLKRIDCQALSPSTTPESQWITSSFPSFLWACSPCSCATAWAEAQIHSPSTSSFEARLPSSSSSHTWIISQTSSPDGKPAPCSPPLQPSASGSLASHLSKPYNSARLVLPGPFFAVPWSSPYSPPSSTGANSPPAPQPCMQPCAWAA